MVRPAGLGRGVAGSLLHYACWNLGRDWGQFGFGLCRRRRPIRQQAELSRRFGVNRRTIHYWIETGQLDRDLSAGVRGYTPRPTVTHKLDPYRAIIDARLEAFPKLSAKRLFDEVRAAGFLFGERLSGERRDQFVLGLAGGFERPYEEGVSETVTPRTGLAGPTSEASLAQQLT